MKLTSLDSVGFGFRSVADVAAYVAKHGAERLTQEEVNTGFEIESDCHWVQLWRQDEREKLGEERRQLADERSERAVTAAEVSAAAAKNSARRATFALVISTLALGIAVYQHFWR